MTVTPRLTSENGSGTDRSLGAQRVQGSCHTVTPGAGSLDIYSMTGMKKKCDK